MSWSDFKSGLRNAGVILADNDLKAIWLSAGGSNRHVSGEIEIHPFLERIEGKEGMLIQQERGRSMESAGYCKHMQSSLTKGMSVR